eukprot:3129294-Amphidinium_carterae.1
MLVLSQWVSPSCLPSTGLALHPVVGLDVAQAGSYLLHLEATDGRPHCVSITRHDCARCCQASGVYGCCSTCKNHFGCLVREEKAWGLFL